MADSDAWVEGQGRRVGREMEKRELVECVYVQHVERVESERYRG
jgi:hypothetical protein